MNFNDSSMLDINFEKLVFLLAARFARPTPTYADLLTPRLAAPKTANRFAITPKLMPERHVKLLPGQVAQAKRVFRLRMSVCVCGENSHLQTQDSTIHLQNDSNSFGGNPLKNNHTVCSKF